MTNLGLSPRVSVIIPAYNADRWIGEAIGSALSQTYTDFELVIVDDGSTDETSEVVAQFNEERIRYIYQSNKGLAGARNTGILESTGEYIAFLDADDGFSPHKLKVQVEALDTNEELSLVTSGWLFVNEQGELLRKVEPWLTHPSLSLYLWLVGCPFVVHGTLLRRKALDNVGMFDESLDACEDTDLFLRMASNNCSMAWVPDIVCYYRIHSGNITHSPLRAKAAITVLDKFFDSPHGNNVSEVIRRRAYGNAWLRIARVQYSAACFDDAEVSVSQAVTLLPTMIQGKSPELTTVIRNWALDPRVFNRPQFINTVFDHLPDVASHLRPDKDRVLAAVRMDSAFWHYSRHEFKSVLMEATSAIAADPSWLRNRGVWSTVAKASLQLLR